MDCPLAESSSQIRNNSQCGEFSMSLHAAKGLFQCPGSHFIKRTEPFVFKDVPIMLWEQGLVAPLLVILVCVWCSGPHRFFFWRVAKRAVMKLLPIHTLQKVAVMHLKAVLLTAKRYQTKMQRRTLASVFANIERKGVHLAWREPSIQEPVLPRKDPWFGDEERTKAAMVG